MKKVMKFLAVIVVILVVLVVVAYFVVTSSSFIKSYILPYAGAQMGADINVSQIEVYPFKSSIVINDLRIEKKNEFDVKVKKLDCLFNVFDLISNKITVNRLDLNDTYINATTVYSEQTTVKTAKVEPEKSKPEPVKRKEKTELPVLNLNNIKIKNFNITYKVIRPEAKEPSETVIKNFNLEIPYFKTSGKGLMNFAGDVSSSQDGNKLAGRIQAKLNAMLNDKTFPKVLNFHSDLILGNNVSPLDFTFTSNEKDGKMPFTLAATLKHLPVDPFLQAFVEKSKDTNGFVDNVNLDANGPDIQNPDLFKTLSGKLNLNVSNLYIPSELLNNPVGRLIMLPVNIIADSGKYFSSNVQGNSVLDVLNNSVAVVKGIKTMEFETGTANVVMNKGNIDIQKFLFTGSQYSVVNSLSINGSVDRNSNLDLKTRTVITAIALPIRIRGTIDNPKPDIKNLLPALLNTNINDLVSSTKGTASDIGDQLSKTGKNFLNSLSDNFGNLQNDEDTTNAEPLDKTINKSVNKVIDNVNSLFK